MFKVKTFIVDDKKNLCFQSMTTMLHVTFNVLINHKYCGPTFKNKFVNYRNVPFFLNESYLWQKMRVSIFHNNCLKQQ